MRCLRKYEIEILNVKPSTSFSFRNHSVYNTEISETIRSRILGFGMQITELLAQPKFVSAGCHARSNANKPPKTVAPTLLVLE